jgi:hypothetical protein
MSVPSIGVSEFVRRQTPESRFSHFVGTWDELVVLVTDCFGKAIQGYRDGVLRVPVHIAFLGGDGTPWFFSSLVEVTGETKLEVNFEARQPGEDAFIMTKARGPKEPAAAVEVILYRKDVLGDEATTGCDWKVLPHRRDADDGAAA